MSELGHHVTTALCALAEDVGANLAVLGIVTFALFSTLLTGTSTGFCELLAVVGLAHHEAGVHGSEIGDVSAEAETFGHVFAFACAFIGAPFAGLRSFEAVVDAVGHLLVLADVRDFGECVQCTSNGQYSPLTESPDVVWMKSELRTRASILGRI